MAQLNGDHGLAIRQADHVASNAIDAYPSPFPARTRHASAVVAGQQTDVMSVLFTDKILITISQAGILAHWVHVPLESADPTFSSQRLAHASEDDGPLPMSHLTATTLLGGGVAERDTLGQLLATQIASRILRRNAHEGRLLVLGLGIKEKEIDAEAFHGLLALVGQCM